MRDCLIVTGQPRFLMRIFTEFACTFLVISTKKEIAA